MTGRRFVLALLAALCAPASAADETLRVAVHASASFEFPGADTAFAVDASLVEVRTLDGKVTLTGRRAGQTLVTVVTPDAVRTLVVRIDPAPNPAGVSGSASARSGAGTWWASYDSGTERSSTGATLRSGAGARHTSIEFQAVHEGARDGEPGRWALPNASIEWVAPGTRVVLLDERVSGTPLTLAGAVVRGLHVEAGRLALHAGIAPASPWNDLLLPHGGERAFDLSWRFGDARMRLIPTLLWLPDSQAARSGVASLAAEHGRADDPFHVKAELGWSAGPGASLDLSLRQPQRQLWLQAATRPAGFAALEVARPAGSYVDGAWSERLGERATASLTVSANRLDLATQRPQAASARLELRRQLDARWSVNASVGDAAYGDLNLATVRRATAALGGGYDTAGFGASLLYRNQRVSNASGPAHGARLTLRASHAGWRASLYADAQQQAPTLDLVYQERPDLARAFTELGIVASTPEDVLKQLRDNAGLLAGLGVGTGAFSLAPLRLQAGGNLAWQDSGPRRLRLSMRLVADERRGIAGASRSALGGVSAAWRIFGDTELSLGLTRWSNRRAGAGSLRDGAFQVTLRTSLTRGMLSALALGAGRPIRGQVLRADSGQGAPLAGIELVLDGSRHTMTDQDGRFEFDAPGRGEHRVEARLPAAPGAYFTTPSSARLPPGGEAQFAISYAAARLSGAVRSDAGLPIAGVSVRLSGAREASTVTDSDGVYRFAVAPGDARVEVVADSVPPGYDLGQLEPQARTLAPDAPAAANFVLRAQRALKGVVTGGGDGPVTVTAVELKRTLTPDKAGNFLLRSLPAGKLTLVASGPHGEVRREVTIPAEPGTVAGIELALVPKK